MITAERVDGTMAFQVLKPLTAPLWDTTGQPACVRRETPQPYSVIFPSASRRDVVMRANDSGLSRRPSIRAMSQRAKSEGVEKIPPAPPSHPEASGATSWAALNAKVAKP